jgi:hypothetical protein
VVACKNVACCFVYNDWAVLPVNFKAGCYRANIALADIAWVRLHAVNWLCEFDKFFRYVVCHAVSISVAVTCNHNISNVVLMGDFMLVASIYTLTVALCGELRGDVGQRCRRFCRRLQTQKAPTMQEAHGWGFRICFVVNASSV